MKILKRILFGVIKVLVLLIILINIYSFISLKIIKKDLVSIGGYSLLEVVSGSMEPNIKIGDLIIINTKSTNYKEDDIITFYDNNNHFVTHRIIKKDKDKIITKGDANNTNDEEITSKKVVGKCVLKISNGGKILKTLQNPFILIMIFIIGVLICMLISTDSIELSKEEREEFKEYLKKKSK